MERTTKQRIVGASADLFRRQGYTGTGIKQIAADAQAPFGSVYHFFPGGKQQLGEAVIRSSGELYGQLIEAFFTPTADVASATHRFFKAATLQLRKTDYADACPIATVALEVASANEQLRRATADVFESWIGKLADRYAAAGIAPVTARGLAISVLTALEGAFVLSRAARSTEALEVAGSSATAAVRAALEGASSQDTETLGLIPAEAER